MVGVEEVEGKAEDGGITGEMYKNERKGRKVMGIIIYMQQKQKCILDHRGRGSRGKRYRKKETAR